VVSPLARYFSLPSQAPSTGVKEPRRTATPQSLENASAKRGAGEQNAQSGVSSSSSSAEPAQKRMCLGAGEAGAPSRDSLASTQAPDACDTEQDSSSGADDRDISTSCTGQQAAAAAPSLQGMSRQPPVQRQRQSEKVPPLLAELFHLKDALAGQYSWPTWLEPENIRDAKGLRPVDPGYDQTSLKIPSEKVQKEEGFGTPMLLQYWKVKSAHFDKVALFKVGKFYELFFYDACIAASCCPLKWMGEKKPHVGFPEMAKNEYAKMIVDAGFKVVVVEQVERVAENRDRVGGVGSCIEREACEIFTSGTVVSPAMLGSASAKFMVYLAFGPKRAGLHSGSEQGTVHFSVCLLDAATARIQVGRFSDGSDWNRLRTLLAQVQPSEAVYAVANIPSDVLTMLKRLPCRPQLSPLRETPSLLVARDCLARYRKEHTDKIPTDLEALLQHDECAQAAAGVIEYLNSVLLGRQVLPVAQWEVLPASGEISQSGQSNERSSSQRMVMDAAALSALEVLETTEGTYKGSLLEFLNHTSTHFGFRLLKQWLCAPLYEEKAIRDRQEAVEFLSANRHIAQQFKDVLQKIRCDLERMTSRVWSYAMQVERQAVMYEDVTGKRLRDFMGTLEDYEQSVRLLSAFPQQTELPACLARVVRLQNVGGEFPDLQPIISRLRNSVIQTEEAGKNGAKCKPRPGVDATYDALCDKIAKVEKALGQELAKIKKRCPGVEFEFGHRLPGYRYEVVCEESALPKDFIKEVEVNGRSGKPVRLRFQTTSIKQLVVDLEHLEDQREDCIYPFLSKLFLSFYSHQAQFRAACRLLAELDVLLSLAAVSDHLPARSCRAEIVSATSPESTGMMELRKCGHPVVAMKLGAAFVPNDVLLNLGTSEAQAHSNIVVVTGPNMGGKSTVLRQTCVAVIMAQLGCRVNAEACRITPVDRIFTRIGSYDTILEGKSTLLCELEETAAILKHGTPRSLAVLDELGRGTSTFDGAAIAAATLRDLAERKRCLALFATHYHPVSYEAAQTGIAVPFHMSADIDERTQEMTFLYTFLPGLCPASHGHHVARLAGLPSQVLEEALARSAEFDRGSAAGSDASSQLVHVREACALAQQGDKEGLRALYHRMQATLQG